MDQQLLPAECFWHRYSRNYELPLSGIVSAMLHTGTLAALLLGVLSLFGDQQNSAVSIDVVAINEGGGQEGHDTEPLLGSHPSGEVTDVVAPRFEPPNLTDAAAKANVPMPSMPTLQLPDESGDLLVSKTPSRPLPRLAPLLKGSPDGTAKKGSGTPGKGPGRGGRILTEREKRQYRWTMLFRTADARDYLRQLQALGAILGVQQKDQNIALITDLSRRPVNLQRAEKHPDRIFWMDDNPQSVAGMAAELRLQTVPWRIIAYFPESLENRLLAKELEYGRRHGRKTESAIRETKFQITFRAGETRLEVVDQK